MYIFCRLIQKHAIFTHSNNKYSNKHYSRNPFKKVVDKLSIVASPKATVIRNSKKKNIDIHQLVLDDIIILKTGDQIAADCKILNNEVEVNESCITGETNTIRKKVGDLLLSGSYIVSGNTTAKIEHIGEENYTAKISSSAKYVKK